MSLKNMGARKPDLEQKPSLAVSTGRPSYAGECGVCVRCKEWTEVGSSCCGEGVWFEGGFVADREEGDGE